MSVVIVILTVTVRSVRWNPSGCDTVSRQQGRLCLRSQPNIHTTQPEPEAQMSTASPHAMNLDVERAGSALDDAKKTKGSFA